MSKLRAALRCCHYLQRHITRELADTVGHHNLPKPVREIHQIEIVLLTICRLLEQDKNIQREAATVASSVDNDIREFVGFFGQHIYPGKKEQWKRAYEAICAGIGSLRKKVISEEEVLDHVHALDEQIRELIASIGEKHHARHLEESLNFGQKLQVWEHLRKDIMRKFERECALVDKMRKQDESAERQLQALEKRHHELYQELDVRTFLELPPFYKLPLEHRIALIQKHKPYGGDFDYTEDAIKAALRDGLHGKPISKTRIAEYLHTRDAVKSFIQFLRDTKRSVKSATE